MPSATSGLFKPIVHRPYLATAIVAGIALYFLLARFIPLTSTRALLSWNAGVVTFLGLSFHYMSGADCSCM